MKALKGHLSKGINAGVIAATAVLLSACSGSESQNATEAAKNGDVATKSAMTNPAPKAVTGADSKGSGLNSLNSGIQNDWGSLERERMAQDAAQKQKNREHELSLKDKDMQMQREQMAADKESQLLQGIMDVTALGAMLNMVTKDKCAHKGLFASMKEAGSSLGDALAAAKKAEQQSLVQQPVVNNAVGGANLNPPQTPPSASPTALPAPAASPIPQPSQAATPPPAAAPSEAKPASTMTPAAGTPSGSTDTKAEVKKSSGFKIPPLGLPMPDDWVI